MKKNKLVLTALLVALPVAALAQNASAPAHGGGQESGNNNPAAASNNNPIGAVDNSVQSSLNAFLHEKPDEGTGGKATADVASAIADRIKAIDGLGTPAMDDPETRARFETYLSLPAVSDDEIKDYFGKIGQISDLLKQGNSFAAWKLLYALSEHKQLDAGISRELANRVEAVWNSDQAQGGLAQANTKLTGDIDTYGHNADMIAEDLHEQDLEENQKTGKGGGGGGSTPNNQVATNSPLTAPNADPVAAEAELMPTMSGGLQRKMELTNEYLKLLEARADIKLNEMRASRMSDQDRADFTGYIKMLYDTHRYYHVIIAADFYRVLFNVADLDNLPNAANGGTPAASTHAAGDMMSLTSKSMGINGQVPINAITAVGNAVGITNPLGPPEGDHPLSISEEVTNALEINNRVNDAIEVFKYKAGKGEIAAAADQLQEAFLANEYHPALQGLVRDDKEKVGDFLDKINVLKNQLEVRDFEQVDGQIDAIKKVAEDFDSTKPMALVNAVKLESRLRLGKAKLLAQSGQLDDAMKEFQTAAEEWPGNPDLQTSASGFFNTEDVQNESTSEFDRLFKDGNFREIFDKQVAFAPAIKGDATREQQFKDALTKVQGAEVASEKANMLVMGGDVDGAWETIEKAANDWPDDTKLNKLLASLSERASDFVSAVNKARDAEAKKELGYSLTWYVNAQSLYPASTIANDGIDRLSKQLLTPANAAGEDSGSSPSPAPSSGPSAAN